MKKKICILLVGCLLLSGCSLFRTDDSQSKGESSEPQSASLPISSMSESDPGSSSQPEDSSQSSSAPTSSSSEADLEQDVSGWIGTYAKQGGSAGQIMLMITEGKETGAVHFALDAKGLVIEGDALIYKEDRAICEEKGNLTLQLGKAGITVTEGKSLSDNADFSGFYEKIA